MSVTQYRVEAMGRERGEFNCLRDAIEAGEQYLDEYDSEHIHIYKTVETRHALSDAYALENRPAAEAETPDLSISLQINIPPDASDEQIESIIRNMRQHLVRRQA